MRTITQTQIAAYERCRRRYFLKYVRELAWPAERSSREEMKRGADFHLLVRQLIMGFPPETLLLPAGDEKIGEWLDHFRNSMPLKGFDRIFAEKEVSALYSDVLWLGKFDALAISDDRIVIFDWKTMEHRAEAAEYRESPQTRLYRFLARTCAARLIGAGLHGIPAENIEMVYWFPEHPGEPIRLPYSEGAYQEDMTWLRMKAREMCSEAEADYPCRDDLRACRFCEYETYCFPKQTAFAAEGMAPEDSVPEFPPVDDVQTDFFSQDLVPDSVDGGISF
ncbi:MAG: PD-(D/E)XK nuclease family protein [Flexilinea sp.]|nr:PD-(D/E)XK nuclease family protein [Flexilinea sp.]